MHSHSTSDFFVSPTDPQGTKAVENKTDSSAATASPSFGPAALARLPSTARRSQLALPLLSLPARPSGGVAVASSPAPRPPSIAALRQPPSASAPAPEAAQAAMRRYRRSTHLATSLLVLASLAMGVLGFELRFVLTRFLLVMNAAIGVMNLIIMCISMAYLFPKAVCGTRTRTSAAKTIDLNSRRAGGIGAARYWRLSSSITRVNAVLVFVAWLVLCGSLLAMFVVDWDRSQYFSAAWTFYSTLVLLAVWAGLLFGVFLPIVTGGSGRIVATIRLLLILGAVSAAFSVYFLFLRTE